MRTARAWTVFHLHIIILYITVNITYYHSVYYYHPRRARAVRMAAILSWRVGDTEPNISVATEMLFTEVLLFTEMLLF